MTVGWGEVRWGPKLADLWRGGIYLLPLKGITLKTLNSASTWKKKKTVGWGEVRAKVGRPVEGGIYLLLLKGITLKSLNSASTWKKMTVWWGSFKRYIKSTPEWHHNCSIRRHTRVVGFLVNELIWKYAERKCNAERKMWDITRVPVSIWP